MLGDHVTLDAGTGAVHTAPGHGHGGLRRRHEVQAADRQSGRQRRPLPCRARRCSQASMCSKRTSMIIAVLKERGALLHEETYQAQLSALLAPQDAGDLPRDPAVVHQHGAGGPARERAARDRQGAVDARRGASSRIGSMIADRPDWCISRQRMWGVPLALFAHRETGEPHPRTPELLERWPSASTKDGIDAWYDARPGRPARRRGEELREGHRHYRRVARLGRLAPVRVASTGRRSRCPPDLYLEGSDQHRGWFHSVAADLGRDARPRAVSRAC